MVGWAGSPNPLLLGGHPGLSNKGFKEHPICPTKSQSCWEYSDRQVPFTPDFRERALG